jgi:hypothetical protein
MWTINRQYIDVDLEINTLKNTLYHLDVSMSAAEWMWLKSEWNEMRIERVSLRKRLANIQKKLSEYEIEYKQVTE